jgi:hypothetical protein
MKIQVTYTPSSGATIVRTFNIGWDSYCCFLQAGLQDTESYTYSYGQNGLQLMSLPLQPTTSDLPTILGIPASKLLLAWWDPNLAGDNKYRLWPSFPLQGLGSAYWLRVTANTTVNMTGLKADPTVPYDVTIGANWNLVGCPRIHDVPLATLQVQQGDNPAVSWAAAVTAHLVQDHVYGFSQTAGYQVGDTISPWQGYWMRCLVSNGVTLIFPPDTTTTTSAARTKRGAVK